MRDDSWPRSVTHCTADIRLYVQQSKASPTKCQNKPECHGSNRRFILAVLSKQIIGCMSGHGALGTKHGVPVMNVVGSGGKALHNAMLTLTDVLTSSGRQVALTNRIRGRVQEEPGFASKCYPRTGNDCKLDRNGSVAREWQKSLLLRANTENLA